MKNTAKSLNFGIIIIISVLFLGLLLKIVLALGLGTPSFIDTADTDFSKGTLHLTNIRGSGAEANVTLNFTTIDTFRVYNTSGNFTSQIFDTNSTTSKFDKIAWSGVLVNSSDVMGYTNDDGASVVAVFYRNGSHSVETNKGNLISDLDFVDALHTYSIPSGWSRDDIIGFSMDDDNSDEIFAFFRNGSVLDSGDLGNTGPDKDITFTAASTWTIPDGFNQSDIIGFVMDTPNPDIAVFFKNRSFVTAASEQPPFLFTSVHEYSLPPGFDANDAIGTAYDKGANDVAMFFKNGSYVADAAQNPIGSDMVFDIVARATYPSGFANLTTYTNITLQTRVSNDSIIFTAWSNNYTNPDGSESIEDNAARYIQYKAVLETPDKYITPYLQNVTINFTSGAAGGDTTKPIINGTLNDTSPQQGFSVNVTYNITDETALNNAIIIINDTGFNRFFNFSLTGTTAQISQNFTVSCAAGCVINVTGRVNDTSGNLAQNETIFTVAEEALPDTTKPNIILDKPDDNYVNDTEQYVNITFNGTANDNSALKNATLYHNVSGAWKANLSTGLSGTSSGFTFSLNLTNATFIWNVEACDTAGNCNFSANNRTVILNFTLAANATTLSILNFTPANNSVNVSLKQDITVIFSQEMNKSTFTNSTVIIKNSNNNKVRGKIKYFTVSKKLRFNPHRFLEENITYTVNLTTGIKSENGISLDSNLIWNFTTELKDTDNDGIPDIDDPDDDNDGIDDADDFLKGINASHIKTDIVGLSIKVNESANISKNFTNQNLVQLFVNDTTIIEFNHSFGNTTIDLTNISIQQNENSSKGSLIINGLTLNSTKTFYLDNLSSHHGLCIKDADVDGIDDISNSCNGTFEKFVTCPGSAGNYNCSMNGTRFKITGLNHSAVQQSDDNNPPQINLISISNSGTSTVTVTLTVITDESATCKYDTSDVSFSSMSNSMSGSTQHTGSKSYSADTLGTYYVLCKDDFGNLMSSSSSISFNADVIESSSGGGSGGSGGGGGGGGSGGSSGQLNFSSCNENWICDGWNECKDNFQTRECIDLNACGTESLKPIEFQTCKKACEEIWQCDAWSVCADDISKRQCYDLNECGTEDIKPSEYEECKFIPQCYNSVQDNSEEGTDCGGPCPACETCFDRIQNQGEKGIDCGGSCRSCRIGDIISTGRIISILPRYTPDASSLFIFLIVVVSILFAFKGRHKFKRLYKKREKLISYKKKGIISNLKDRFRFDKKIKKSIKNKTLMFYKKEIISKLKDKIQLNNINSKVHIKGYSEDTKSLRKYGFEIKPKHITKSVAHKEQILNKLKEVYKHG